MLTLNLNNELEQEFNTIAEQSGKSTQQVLKGLVLDYLEDCHDILNAEQTLKEIDAGTEKVFTLEEAKKELNALEN